MRGIKPTLFNSMIYFIFILSISLTIYAYFISIAISRAQYQSAFALQTQELATEITKKIKIYEQVLWAGVALFNSSEHVSRDEWQTFNQTLSIERHWPGIQALGYAIALQPDEVAQHEKFIRAQGFKNYHIYPKGQREQYSSIIYIEPFDWRNQRAFGYDMWSNPVRQKAMKRAIKTGKASASGSITLVQETNNDLQKGFLIYIPLYQKNISIRQYHNEVFSSEKNIEHIKGWVYAPFRINDFMTPIINHMIESIGVRLTDITHSPSTQMASDNALFNYSPWHTSTALDKQSTQLNILGRTWQLETTQPLFRSYQNLRKESFGLLSISLIIDFLLFFVLLKYRNQKNKNKELIKTHHNNLVSELRESKNANIALNQENISLNKQILVLEEWLQERELRISELKLNQQG